MLCKFPVMDILQSFVPPLVAAHLGQDAPSRPWGERLEAVIVFADISGFTALAESSARQGAEGTERMSALLDDYFSELFGLVERHRGQVLKIAGDAPIAVWPVGCGSRDQAAARAAACALEMVAVTRPGLTLRAGLGMGEGLLASVGGQDNRWEFLVAGPPLAQAAQAEQQARPGQVVVSPEIWACLQPLGASADGYQLLGIPEQDELPPSRAETAGAQALRAYLPKAVLAPLEAGHLGWLNELRPLALLFGCLEGLDYAAGDVLERLQAATVAIQTSIYAHDGELSQLLSDDKGTIFLAAFGLPAHDDDARRAFLAARQVQVGLHQVGLGCSQGISWGRVFCGVRGSASRREYCLIGDRVNLASRLMQASQGGILCDWETRQRIGASLDLVEHPTLKLKGVSQPVRAFAPGASAHPHPTSPEVTEEALFGRAEELEWLLAGRGPRLLEGEAGLGKSHLIAAFCQQRPCLVGRIDALDSQKPFAAVCQLLRARPQDHGLWQAEPGAAQVALLLEGAMDESLSGSALHEILSRFFLARLGYWNQAGLTIVMEDCHWLDASSREVLMQAASEGRHLVLVTRPWEVRDPRWSGLPRRVLGPLSLQAVNEVAASLLAANRVATSLLEFVHQKAEGSPYFTRELIFGLREAGFLEVVEGEARLRGSAHDTQVRAMVESVAGILTSRLDRLQPGQLLTLKVASVVGRSFPFPVVESVYPRSQDRHSLLTYLAELRAQHLTLLESESVHSFQHALLHEVTYSLLLYAQRRELHETVARWYEEHDPGQSILLSFHWERSSHPLRAVPYLERSGLQALHQGAYVEAREFLQRALQPLTDHPPERERLFRLRRHLAEAHYALGDLEECRQALTQALRGWGWRVPQTRGELWREKSYWLYEALRLPSRLPGRVGQFLAECLDHVLLPLVRWHTGATLASPPSQAPGQMDLVASWERLCMVHAYTGGLELSFYAGSWMSAQAEKLGPTPSLGRAYAMGGAGCVTLLTYPRCAEVFLRRAQVLERRLQDRSLTLRVRYCQSALPLHRGDWVRAEELLSQSASLSDEVQDHRQSGEIRVLWAEAMLSQGRLEEARVMLESVHSRGRVDPQEKAWTLAYLGLLQALRGQVSLSFDSLHEAGRLAPERDDIVRTLLEGGLALNRLLQGKAAPLCLPRPTPSLHWCRLGVFWATWSALQSGQDASQGVNTLGQGARFHPLCRPAAWLCRGLQGGERRYLEKSAQEARSFSLPVEEALARHALGQREAARQLLQRHGVSILS